LRGVRLLVDEVAEGLCASAKRLPAAVLQFRFELGRTWSRFFIARLTPVIYDVESLNPVSTSLICPGFRRNAASSKGATIMPLEKNPDLALRPPTGSAGLFAELLEAFRRARTFARTPSARRGALRFLHSFAPLFTEIRSGFAPVPGSPYLDSWPVALVARRVDCSGGHEASR